jgi:hypothetical protein
MKYGQPDAFLSREVGAKPGATLAIGTTLG